MPETRVHLFANNASAKLAAGITAAQTSIELETGAGARFPSPISGEQIFKVTLRNIKTGEFEVLNVTQRVTDVLTVERAQEGSVAQAFNPQETLVQHHITAETLDYLQDLLAAS